MPTKDQYTKLREHRDGEYQTRWRANYDLLYAQLLAYQARVYEYGAALDHFIANPKTAPMYKSPKATLTNWAVHLCKETKADDVTAETIANANERFLSHLFCTIFGFCTFIV